MLQNTFCSSPWIHIRIRNNGNYSLCRWAKDGDTTANIANVSLLDFYNNKEMSDLRLDLLSGNSPKICSGCYYEDSFNKLNGRKKQLLKSGITNENFALKMRSSPHYSHFLHSWQNNGESNYYPVDLQIDLGNVCNSSCIMCRPMFSSKLEKDYKQLNSIEPTLFESPETYKSWTRDEKLVDKFVDEIGNIPRLNYIHFIGGETLYDSAFYKICDRLIEKGLAPNVMIGTTTNCTVYNDKIETYAKSFKQFHLGLSIETVDSLNDYVRYPSNISVVKDIIQKFLNLRLQHNRVFLNLRITPNIFTIYKFDELVEYMIENNIPAESCNILQRPSVLRMELLPDDIRQETIEKFKKLISKYNLIKDENVINIRKNETIDKNISNTVIEYYDFLCKYKTPHNVENERYNLIKFINAFEKIRNNRITDHAPRYAEFLQHYGY